MATLAARALTPLPGAGRVNFAFDDRQHIWFVPPHSGEGVYRNVDLKQLADGSWSVLPNQHLHLPKTSHSTLSVACDAIDSLLADGSYERDYAAVCKQIRLDTHMELCYLPESWGGYKKSAN